MRGIEMAVCVTYECHNQIQAHSSSWLTAGLQYLQCICNGDAAVLPRTINIMMCGQCTGWCLSGTRTLSVFMMILYVTMKLTICVELICNRFDTSMSYVSLYIQTAWGRRAIYVSPVHLWWGCCGLALKHPYSVQVVAMCLTGTGPPDLSMMTLLHTHKTVYMCSFEMSACVTYECHMQAHKSRWFVAGQQYLHCICDRDTAVLH